MPINVAEMNGAKESIAMLIDIVDQLLAGGSKVQVIREGVESKVSLPGDVTAEIPAMLTLTATAIDGGVRLSVGRPYIRVRKSIMRGVVDAVSLTQDQIDVSLRGLPDVSIKVNE